MASAKKSNARRRPVSAAQERKPDVASPAIVSGATAALRVVPSPIVPDPEVGERAARRRFTAEYKLRVLREADQYREYIDVTNRNPKPFVWTKTADDILTSIERFCQRISGTGH